MSLLGPISSVNLAKRFSRRIHRTQSRILNHITNTRIILIIRARRYNSAVKRHQPLLPKLSRRWLDVVDRLNADGLVQTELSVLDLAGSRAMFQAALDLIAEWQPRLRAQAKGGNDFLRIPAEQVAERPEIYRFGLNPELLDLVENYIGLPVAYDGVTIQYTMADGREVSTREWHRDREDRRMVKLAIYLVDVDANGGPFELWAMSNPNCKSPPGKANFYLSADQRSDLESGHFRPLTSCKGVAGTAIFADTARFFHRGKPTTTTDRAAVFFSYFSRVPQRPFFCSRAELTPEQIESLADGLTVPQKAAALWQANLPRRWKYLRPDYVD